MVAEQERIAVRGVEADEVTDVTVAQLSEIRDRHSASDHARDRLPVVRWASEHKRCDQFVGNRNEMTEHLSSPHVLHRAALVG